MTGKQKFYDSQYSAGAAGAGSVGKSQKGLVGFGSALTAKDTQARSPLGAQQSTSLAYQSINEQSMIELTGN